MTNRAMTLTEFGGKDAITLSTTQMPVALPGVAIVRVKAAGINGLDWKIREGYLRDVMPVQFPTVLGLELAGEIVATGADSRFKIGDRVFGLAAPGQGAYADQVAVPGALLAPIPPGLSDVLAAALPVASLTAWQMLHAAGVPRAGQTIIVHGASGGVGTVLVQLAKNLGLKVVATASADSRMHLQALGVDTIIDRKTESFENLVSDVDLVIDLAGADAPDRSWAVLREGGTLVSAARFDVGAPRADGRKGVAFMMQPDSARLDAIAQAAAAGEIKVVIAETVSPAGVPDAIERNRIGHAPGKTVADFTRA
ncbi:NADP-dependent oxidoreductase [Devosia sp. BK]|uniref:NADP-dependent oxidoreductase n=1 Tax=Devosia sp. BK TaxID=2871706 RepID=UPI00293AAF85|nr:NADP-dependent oxidoreductase [Devosia sp. BK]MDV3253079.1 NADP-dependent oxidoreductase [Devosia sp. BK]